MWCQKREFRFYFYDLMTKINISVFFFIFWKNDMQKKGINTLLDAKNPENKINVYCIFLIDKL